MGYRVIDSQTGSTVREYKTRRLARAKVDKLDLAYGAIRYTVVYVADLAHEVITDEANAKALAAVDKPVSATFSAAAAAILGGR